MYQAAQVMMSSASKKSRGVNGWLAALVGVAVALSGFDASAQAYLAQGSTVVKVSNTGSNARNFAVQVSGGSGSCVGVYIHFPEVDAPDAKTHQRAYAAALLALTTGLPVQIYNYLDSSCARAGYIEVWRP